MVSIFFLLTLILLLILNLFKILEIKKNYIISLFITLFIVSFTLNLSSCLKAVLEGATLWFNSILPTVLPFTFLCNLLMAHDGIFLFSTILGPILCRPLGLSKNCSFPLAASLLCGYPLGAKYSSDLYKLNYITKDEYIRVLNIASNCSPIFILGTVSISMLNNTFYGYILLFSNYISILIIGLITKRKKSHLKTKDIGFKCGQNFGEAIKSSLESSINTTISIGGFIIIFSLLISLIKDNVYINIIFQKIDLFLGLDKNILHSFFLGSIEITNGCNLISKAPINISLKLAMISFFCSFSGISIISQVSSFISSNKVSVSKYSLLKTLQGLISFVLTYILSEFFITSIETSNSINVISKPLIYTLLLPFFLMLLVYIIVKIIYNLLLHFS